MNTQYCFRTGRSTSHAIFIARPLESFAEISWKNVAFNTIYTRPKLRVFCDEGKSDCFFQESGTRQGCPFSPYLFILVVSVMFCRHLFPPSNKGNQSQEFILVKIFLRMQLLWTELLKEIVHEFELLYQTCINLTTSSKLSTIKYQGGNIDSTFFSCTLPLRSNFPSFAARLWLRRHVRPASCLSISNPLSRWGKFQIGKFDDLLEERKKTHSFQVFFLRLPGYRASRVNTWPFQSFDGKSWIASSFL